MADSSNVFNTRPTLRPTNEIHHTSVIDALKKMMTWDNLWLGLLMIVILMRYPMTIVTLAGDMAYRPLFEYYTHAAVGMFALGMLLTNIQWFKTRLTVVPAVLSAIIGVSALMHIILGGDEYTFEGIMLVAIPIIAFLKFRSLFTLLPWYIALVWAMDVFHALHWAKLYYPQYLELAKQQSSGFFVANPNLWSFLDHWFNSTLDVVSIAGNRNWQAAFLVATTPFACWVAWRAVRFCYETQTGRIIAAVIAEGFILGISLFCYAPMDSRASVLTLCFGVVVMALIFFLRLFRGNRRLQLFILAGIIFGGTLLVGSGTWLCRDQIAQKAHQLNVTDVRIPMWHAAIDFIMETQPPSRTDFYPPQGVGLRWLTGSGSQYFEDQYVIYRMPDYFTRPSPANRTDYPHNHTFYVAGYLGVPAAVAWLLLALIPMTAAFFRLIRNAKFRGHWALPFWCILVLLPHAQLDLIMEYWPMAAFLLLSLGLLWRVTWPAKTGTFLSWKEIIAQKKTGWMIFRSAALTLGLFLVVWSGYFAYRFGMSNVYERDATMVRDMLSMPEFADRRPQIYAFANKAIRDSLEWEPAMDVAYIGLVNAWTGFSRYERIPRIRWFLSHIYGTQRRYNYCNVNWFDAILAEESGDMDRAEAGYLRQTRVYPVGFLGWMSLRDFYSRHNRPAERDYCEQQLDSVIAIKGIIVDPKQWKPKMTFAQALALPNAKDYFYTIIQTDPTVDLKPWGHPNYVRPDSDFPTFDESRWPDMSFVYRRLGPNLEFKKITAKDDPLLIPFLSKVPQQ